MRRQQSSEDSRTKQTNKEMAIAETDGEQV